MAATCPIMEPEEPTNMKSNLPIYKIPADYGLPFIGPIKDRLDYFYNQGVEGFFRSRMEKYGSTVFRANMPPAPLVSSNSKVVALLDGNSFPVLFDVAKVEKDLFIGTFMPSTKLTGGYQVLSYLDPSEPNHAKLMQFLLYLLKSSSGKVIPEFSATYKQLFASLEKEVEAKGKAGFNDANDQAAFNFLVRTWFSENPAHTPLWTDGPSLITKWVLFQLRPILTLGLPKWVEEPTIHSFPLPPFLIKKDYQRLYDFFYSSAGLVLDKAEELGS